jgi:hypothetical protein
MVDVTQSTDHSTRRTTMRSTLRAIGTAAMLLVVGAAAAVAQPIAGLQSPWSVIGSGGSIGSSAVNVQLSSTVGQPAIGPASNAAMKLHLGFWYPTQTQGPASVHDPIAEGGYELKQNYPNPFRTQTTISYYVPQRSRVRVKVYNLVGDLVKVLVDDVVEAGQQEVTWDGISQGDQPVGSGDYLCEMEATSLDATAVTGSRMFRQRHIMHLVK